MTTSAELPIAVIGATGQQGRSVIDALLPSRVPIRALVRNPGSAAARELSTLGVELVQADQEDVQSLAAGLQGVAALFFMTTFTGGDGTEGEVRRGLTVVDAAAQAQVPRTVYSSVGGAERTTGVPHFDSKYEVEKRVRTLPAASVLRPTFFMENLTEQLALDGDGGIVIRMPMPGDVPVQMVAVQDIGRAAARLLLEPDAIDSDAIEIAGDDLTLDTIATQASEVLGVPARFETIPLEYLGEDEDLKAMFRWFVDGPAYQADLARSHALVPEISDVRTWLSDQRTAAGKG